MDNIVKENIKKLNLHFKEYLQKYLKSNMEDNFKIDIDEEKITYFLDIIKKAINENQKIFIYGDYDVDGIGSTAYMHEFIADLAKIQFNKDVSLEYLIPSRNNNYGLDYENYTNYYRDQNDLIIILDNGTHSEFFKKLTDKDKKKTLIIDHHPNGDFKQEIGVINPNSEGKMGICTGILIEYLFQEARKKYSIFASKRPVNHYMDFTTLTLISDMANLNNKIVRKIIEMGINKIEKRERAIYKEIFKNPNSKIDMTDLAFDLIPLLNSAGRLSEDPSYATDVLIKKTEDKDKEWIKNIDILKQTNSTRKDATTYYYNKFKDNANIDEISEKDLVIYKLDENNEEYGRINATGLCGLIAGDIFNVYGKDTIAISKSPRGDYYTGSGRGIAVKKHLENIAQLMEENGIKANTVFSFGGHNRASGVRIYDLKCFEETTSVYLRRNYGSIASRKINIIDQETHDLIDFVSLCNIYKKSVKSSIKLNDSFYIIAKAKIVGYKEYARDFMNLTLGQTYFDEKTKQDKLYIVNIFCKKNEEINYNSPEEQKIILEITPNVETAKEQQHNYFKAQNKISSSLFSMKTIKNSIETLDITPKSESNKKKNFLKTAEENKYKQASLF